MFKKFLLSLILTLFLLGCVGTGGSSSNTPSSTTQLVSISNHQPPICAHPPVGLTSFSLAVNETTYSGTFESNVRDGNVIQVNLPLNTATALNQESLPLIATFTTESSQDVVTVNGVTQVSGTSYNNFWYKVVYTVSVPCASVTYTVYALGWNSISANTPWTNSSDTHGFTTLALDSSGDIFVGGWQQGGFLGFGDDGSTIQVYNASTGTWGGGPAGSSPFSDDRDGVSSITPINSTSAYVGTIAYFGGDYYTVTSANTLTPNSTLFNSFSAISGVSVLANQDYFLLNGGYLYYQPSVYGAYSASYLTDIPLSQDSQATSLATDANGNLWVGSFEGVSIFVFPSSNYFKLASVPGNNEMAVATDSNLNIYGASSFGTIQSLSMSNNNTPNVIPGSAIYTNQNVANTCNIPYNGDNSCNVNMVYDGNDNLFFLLFTEFDVMILGTPVIDTSGNIIINALPIPPVSLFINANFQYTYLFDNTYNNVVTMGTDNNIYWLHFPLSQPN